MEITQQHLLTLAADVGTALTACDSVADMLNRCAQAFVKNLDVAFARIWILDEAQQTLVLRASAGMYTHLDGKHARIKLGEYKIGQIAQERRAHLTNDVPNDDRVSDQEWVRATGMVAFAGHPLLVNDKLVGVLAMFAKHPLSDGVMQAIASVADGIALGIDRKKIEHHLNESEYVFSQFANNFRDVLWIVDARREPYQVVWVSPALEEVMGLTLAELYADPGCFLDMMQPEDRVRMYELMQETGSMTPDTVRQSKDVEYRINRKDGELRWLWTRAFPCFDSQGRVYQICGFTHDITERKESERRVSEFYSTVSHELRTPLTSIRAALGLIEGGVTGENPSETLELVSIARKESDRLIRLINDILDMRKMEAGKLPLTIVPIQPQAVTFGTTASMRNLALESGVDLINCIEEERPFLGDYDRCVQVLTNLLSNAIKFSPSGSTVSMSVQPGFEGRVRFAVSDQGPGIAKEHQSKLFGVFQQVDSSDSRARGGTGLGLAISKAIIERLGGLIGFDTQEGKGSTFWFELPLAERNAIAAPQTPPTPIPGLNKQILREFVEEYSNALPQSFQLLRDRLREASND